MRDSRTFPPLAVQVAEQSSRPGNVGRRLVRREREAREIDVQVHSAGNGMGWGVFTVLIYNRSRIVVVVTFCANGPRRLMRGLGNGEKTDGGARASRRCGMSLQASRRRRRAGAPFGLRFRHKFLEPPFQSSSREAI